MADKHGFLLYSRRRGNVEGRTASWYFSVELQDGTWVLTRASRAGEKAVESLVLNNVMCTFDPKGTSFRLTEKKEQAEEEWKFVCRTQEDKNSWEQAILKAIEDNKSKFQEERIVERTEETIDNGSESSRVEGPQAKPALLRALSFEGVASEILVDFELMFGRSVPDKDIFQERIFSGGLWNSRIRSLCWKMLLSMLPESTSEWIEHTSRERAKYDTSSKGLKLHSNPSQLANLHQHCDDERSPLSSETIAQHRLQFEIWKDLERTRLGFEFVGQGHESIKQVMLRVLFVWGMKNKDIGYRQGMNEILAVILQVLQSEYSTVHQSFAGIQASESNVRLLKAMFNIKFVEHDAYLLLDEIVTRLLPIYDAGSSKVSGEDEKRLETLQRFDLHPDSLPSRLEHIQHRLLQRADPELAAHMHAFGVEPYMFLIRWMRVMFSREIAMPQLFLLWDAIFAFSPNDLSLIDSVCATLLTLPSLRGVLLACNDSSDILQAIKNIPFLKEDEVLKLVFDARALYLSYKDSVDNFLRQVEAAEAQDMSRSQQAIEQTHELDKGNEVVEEDGWLRIDAVSPELTVSAPSMLVSPHPPRGARQTVFTQLKKIGQFPGKLALRFPTRRKSSR